MSEGADGSDGSATGWALASSHSDFVSVPIFNSVKAGASHPWRTLTLELWDRRAGIIVSSAKIAIVL